MASVHQKQPPAKVAVSSFGDKSGISILYDEFDVFLWFLRYCYDEIVRKGFSPIAILVVVALIVAVGGIAYWQLKLKISSKSETTTKLIKPTPTSTPLQTVPSGQPYIIDSKSITGWKTYTNVNYQISFPSSYSIFYEPIAGAGDGIGIMSSPNAAHGVRNLELEEGELKVEIYVTPYPNKTLDDYIIDAKNNGVDVESFLIEKTTLNNLPSLRVEHKLILADAGESYILVHNGFLFRIYKYPSRTSATREQEYKSILATFKFTN